MNEKEVLKKVWKEWLPVSYLGSGAYGMVFKAERKIQERSYFTAIKIVKIPESDTRRIRKAESEVAIMYDMRDEPYIVRIESFQWVDVPELEEKWLLIRMELGTCSMEDMLQEKPYPFDREKTVDIMIDLCDALQGIHDEGVLHRDIKPLNLLLITSRRYQSGKFKFSDFGGAKYMDKTKSGNSGGGTPDYAAPELLDSNYLKEGEDYDKTIDIYSLGLVMYVMLNYGEKISMLDRLRSDGLPEGKPVLADEKLRSIIQKACSFAKEDRYQSAIEMKQALEGWKKAAGLEENEETELDQAEKTEPAEEKGQTEYDLEQFESCKLAAEGGDSTAQWKLGYMCEYGWGTEQDDKEAFNWFKKSADQGNAESQLFLGHMYEIGQGVEKNEKLAEEYYLKAAKQGKAVAYFDLGELYKEKLNNQEEIRSKDNPRAYIESIYSQAKIWYSCAVEHGYDKRKQAEALIYLEMDRDYALKNNQ